MVELTVERPDGSLAFIANDGSGPSATARLQLASPGPCACPVSYGADAGGAEAFLLERTATGCCAVSYDVIFSCRSWTGTLRLLLLATLRPTCARGSTTACR